MKLAIIVGHKLTEPGSYGVDPLNCYEYEWYKPLAQEMYRIAKGLVLDCHVFTRDGLTIEKVGRAVDVWAGTDNACAIELHWNSFNGKIEGTETWYDLVPPEGKDLAREIQDAMVALYNRKHKADRDIKLLTEKDRGYYNAAFVNIPYCLIEPGFADAKADAKLIFEKRIALAISVVSAAHKFLSSRQELKIS